MASVHLARREFGGVTRWSPQFHEPAFGRRMQVGKGLAEADAEGPGVLRAESAVADDARVLGSGEAARPALAREAQRLADPLADGPARLARREGNQGQVLGVLLA